MGSCLAAPRPRRSKSVFHFPNFTFAHSQLSIPADHPHKRNVQRHPRRRHSVECEYPASQVRLLDSSMGKTSADQEYASPPGPPPGYRVQWHDPSGQPSEHYHVGAANNAHKSGPQGMHHYESPTSEQYTAPDGPPPWQRMGKGNVDLHDDDILPPPGPPPPKHTEAEPAPPPYDPWLAVPDNATLPPPPSFFEDTSPTANASYDDAARAHAWCAKNPLWQPRHHDSQTLSRIYNGDVRLTTPPNAANIALRPGEVGKTHVQTQTPCPDTIMLSDIPLFAAMHRPRTLQKPMTIYFELHVMNMGDRDGDAGIAVGFVVPPYPAWRLPGWHRASLAVHGDDGRRYVDNSDGGQEFTSSFRRGDVVGIGMTFSHASFAGGRERCHVFFTRNGGITGGWDLHEERDREQEGGDIRGLEGAHDILAAVGCFGAVEFEARFCPRDWLWKG